MCGHTIIHANPVDPGSFRAVGNIAAGNPVAVDKSVSFLGIIMPRVIATDYRDKKNKNHGNLCKPLQIGNETRFIHGNPHNLFLRNNNDMIVC